MTDFPTQGEDQKVSLRNSNWPQFDYGYAEQLKEEHPTIWGAGGNIRGNEAYLLWEKARDGAETDGVLDWIKEREAWAARHAGDGSHFPGDEPTLSNIAGVVNGDSVKPWVYRKGTNWSCTHCFTVQCKLNTGDRLNVQRSKIGF